jgi:asparagine synthase (glutamine-hydrolysing)
MCGIYLASSKQSQLISRFTSFSKLKNRGPDYSCFKFTQSFIEQQYLVYGYHRLAINDLSQAGNQPFYYNDGSFLICNGEIFNSDELKREYCKNINFNSESDCEVLLHLYKKYGLEFINKLNGEFSIIIYDNLLNKVVIARDMVGVKPLYYSYNKLKKSFEFSSELKAIQDFDGKHFPPGCIAELNPNMELTIKKYYDCHEISKNKIDDSYNNLSDALRKSLETSVKRRLISDVPIGCFLSGGLDSSAIAAIANSLSDKPLSTFTLRIEGLHNEDVIYANEVAKHINSDHHEIVTTLEEIYLLIDEVIYIAETYNLEMVPNLILIYLVAKYVAENTEVKVLLDGTGPDEMLGAYWFFKDAPSMVDFEIETVKQLSEMHRTELLGDRVISHFGLESRYPYLDCSVRNLLLQLPSSYKFYKNDVTEKHILRQAVSSYLPDSVVNRKKMGMTHGAGINFENIFDNEIKRRIGERGDNDRLSNERIVDTTSYYDMIFNKSFSNSKNVECKVTASNWRKDDPLAIWR